MHSLSIGAKDFHTDEQVVDYYNAGDSMRCRSKTRGLLGRLVMICCGDTPTLKIRDSVTEEQLLYGESGHCTQPQAIVERTKD